MSDTLSVSVLDESSSLLGVRQRDRNFSETPHPHLKAAAAAVVENAEDTKKLIDALESTAGLLRRRLSYQHKHKQAKLSQCMGRITSNLLAITTIWQCLFIGVLSLIDLRLSLVETAFLSGTVIMVVLQIVNLFLVILSSVKLTRQFLERWQVSSSFLAQSYLSTVLLFAGLYSVGYKLLPGGWVNVDNSGQGPLLTVILFTKMLYFSVSTATLCGSSHILPAEWYTYLIVSLQMLLSYMYFASILGQTVGSSLHKLKSVDGTAPAPARTTVENDLQNSIKELNNSIASIHSSTVVINGRN